MATHKQSWWSIELPDHWVAESEPECATFRAVPEVGVLQLSPARKNSAAVTREDLLEFLGEKVPAATPLRDVVYGPFSGLAVQYVKDNLSRTEWLLKSGHVMLFVTYYVEQDKQETERDLIERILASLKAWDKPSDATN